MSEIVFVAYRDYGPTNGGKSEPVAVFGSHVLAEAFLLGAADSSWGEAKIIELPLRRAISLRSAENSADNLRKKEG